MKKHLQPLLTLLVVMFLNVMSSTLNAQTSSSLFPYGLDGVIVQPTDFDHVGTASADAALETAYAENGTIFKYGYIDGGNFVDGTISIDSISSVGQGWWVQNEEHSQTAVIYNNADSQYYFHDNSFFAIGYPSTKDNNHGNVVIATSRSNGSVYSIVTAITVRDENDLSLVKEYYVRNSYGAQQSVKVTLLADDKLAIHIHHLSSSNMTLYSSITTSGHQFTGGTEIELPNVPSFSYNQRAVLIVDLVTDEVTGRIVSEDYETTVSANEYGYLNVFHKSNSIVVDWYNSEDSLVNSKEDSIPCPYPGGFDASGDMPYRYSFIEHDSSGYVALSRRGNTLYKLNTVNNQIEIMTDTLVSTGSSYYNEYIVKGDIMFAFNADNIAHHVDMYDLSVGPNYFVGHLRNDVVANGQIYTNLGSANSASFNVKGDTVVSSYTFDSPVGAVASIGSMEDFSFYANRTKSISFSIVLPDNPFVTQESMETTFSGDDVDYVESVGFRKFIVYAKPNADLENFPIDVNAGSAVLSYLMYENKVYYSSSAIVPILSGEESDFTINNSRIITVSNGDNSVPTTMEDTYQITVLYAPDTDANGVSDREEGIVTLRDTDGDGTPDYIDNDNDGDGESDAAELAFGAPAHIDNNDEDADGIINESHYDDEDGDGLANAFDPVNNIGINEFDSDVNTYSQNLSLFVQCEKNLTVSLYDLAGRFISNKVGSNLVFQDLVPGIYLAKMQDENNNIATRKVLVQ